MFFETGENWSLELRMEHRLKVSESRGLRKIFGSTTGVMRGDGRWLRNGELYDFHRSPNIFRAIFCMYVERGEFIPCFGGYTLEKEGTRKT
jgi:hypothetical protein